MSEKKSPVKSMTLVGGAGAIIVQTLIGMDLVPVDANAPANAAISAFMELARNILVIVALYGARRAKGDLTKLIVK